jgi:hypothetical protein
MKAKSHYIYRTKVYHHQSVFIPGCGRLEFFFSRAKVKNTSLNALFRSNQESEIRNKLKYNF